jgi:DNA excision repair protein ERCC-3
LTVDEVAKLQKELAEKLSSFKQKSEELEKEFEKTLLSAMRKGVKINKSKLKPFMQHFWIVYPTKNPNEWEVGIPIILPFNIGWYDRTVGGYNIFQINQYTRWLGQEIPAFIMEQITLPPTIDIKVKDDEVTFNPKDQEKVEQQFGQHLSLVDKGKATIKQGKRFHLVADILSAGYMPFARNPVAEEDKRESDFTKIKDTRTGKYYPLKIFEGKYSYQGHAWETFEKFGAICVFWLMSMGKTVIGTYIFSRIKGRKALVVPTKTLEEHWKQFFRDNCPRLLDEVEIYTYYGMSSSHWLKLQKQEFAVIGFDECHFLPAPLFSKIATLKTKYRFGLSATPYREDGKADWIMSLTGPPEGIDTKTIMEELGKEYHTVNVHVVKDLEAKYELMKQLYNPARRTIIFVNLLDVGKKASEMLNLPMISGQTKDRYAIIKKSHSFIATKVLELGVSIKDLQHIIEVDFLFGSRREQVQRTGRLLHSEMKGKVHDIIFTKEEIEKYGKRLYGLYEKGFRYRLIPHLTGITITSKTKPKKSTPKPTTKKGIAIVDEIFNEGFFQISRKFPEVEVEIARRGGKVAKPSLFEKLNRMTTQGKLFKTKTAEGYVFTARGR